MAARRLVGWLERIAFAGLNDHGALQSIELLTCEDREATRIIERWERRIVWKVGAFGGPSYPMIEDSLDPLTHQIRTNAALEIQLGTGRFTEQFVRTAAQQLLRRLQSELETLPPHPAEFFVFGRLNYHDGAPPMLVELFGVHDVYE